MSKETSVVSFLIGSAMPAAINVLINVFCQPLLTLLYDNTMEAPRGMQLLSYGLMFFWQTFIYIQGIQDFRDFLFLILILL